MLGGTTIKSPSQVEWACVLCNLRLSLLLNSGCLECGNDPLCIEMLQLIVLWHKLGEDLSEFLDLRSQAKLLDQAICVLFQLFRFDLLISVDEINALIQVLNLLTSLLVLAGLVLSQVVEKDLS